MLNLSKGTDLDITKATAATSLASILVGLGWDPAQEGADLDFDASVVTCNGREKVNVCYYGQLSQPGVKHSGDDLTGNNAAGDNPDEEINITLADVAGDRLEIICTLHEAAKRNQTIASAEKAFLRLSGDFKGEDGEGAQFDMVGAGLTGYAIHFATLYRDEAGDWHVFTRGDDLGQVDLNQAVDAVVASTVPPAADSAAA